MLNEKREKRIQVRSSQKGARVNEKFLEELVAKEGQVDNRFGAMFTDGDFKREDSNAKQMEKAFRGGKQEEEDQTKDFEQKMSKHKRNKKEKILTGVFKA